MNIKVIMSSLIRLIFKGFYGYALLPVIRFFFKFIHYSHRSVPNEAKNILINLSDHTYVGLGDAVIYNTIIRLLKYRYPTARLVLLIGKRNRFLEVYWKKHSFADDFLIHPPLSLRYFFSWINVFSELRKSRFDFSIIQSIEQVRGLDSTWFPIDPAVTFILGVRNIIGFYDRWNENCFYSSIVSQLGADRLPPDTPGPRWTGPHWIDIAREYAKTLQIPEPEISLVCKPAFNIDPIPLTISCKTDFRISINPGGDQIWNRRWPLIKYEELCVRLCKELNVSIFLVGGPEEVELRKELCTKVLERHQRAQIFVIDANTLNETANFIFKSDIFIGNDSGLTHLTAAIGTTIIAIYGPSNYAFWGPHRIDSRHKIVSLSLPCMPCEHLLNLTGIADCHLPREKYKCLNDLEVDLVYREVIKKLLPHRVSSGEEVGYH